MRRLPTTSAAADEQTRVRREQDRIVEERERRSATSRPSSTAASGARSGSSHRPRRAGRRVTEVRSLRRRSRTSCGSRWRARSSVWTGGGSDANGVPRRRASSPAMVQQRAADLGASEMQGARCCVASRSGPHGRRHASVTQACACVRGRLAARHPRRLRPLAPGRLPRGPHRPARRQDLGDAVLLRAYKQQIELPDEWETRAAPVPGAREVSRELRRLDWAATALLDHQPHGRLAPLAPSSHVTARHAIGASARRTCSGWVPTPSLDGDRGAHALGDASPAVVGCGRSTAAAAPDRLGRRAVRRPGGLRPAGGAAPGAVTPLAVGLALDVLWPDDGDGAPWNGRWRPAVRVERYVDGRAVPSRATAVARVAKAAVLRTGPRRVSPSSPSPCSRPRPCSATSAGPRAPSSRPSCARVTGWRVRALAAALDSGTGRRGGARGRARPPGQHRLRGADRWRCGCTGGSPRPSRATADLARRRGTADGRRRLGRRRARRAVARLRRPEWSSAYRRLHQAGAGTPPPARRGSGRTALSQA